jgi:hypothetical protein
MTRTAHTLSIRHTHVLIPAAPTLVEKCGPDLNYPALALFMTIRRKSTSDTRPVSFFLN